MLTEATDDIAPFAVGDEKTDRHSVPTLAFPGKGCMSLNFTVNSRTVRMF
jgi:hypothetical protein